LNQSGTFERVKHISLFSQVQIYDALNGDAPMGEEKQEKTDVTQIEKLEYALEEERRRSEECFIRLKYMQADLENLRKRFDREINEAKEHCNERLMIQLLEIVDELEMAVKIGRSSNSADTLTQGVEMTLQKLSKMLKNEGVSPIDCLGKPFDPSKHDAVAKTEKDDAKECTVVEEVRKGYVMKEKVIRPSIVKVVVKPSSKPQKEMNLNE
jgi:molecular chaperone GrpE